MKTTAIAIVADTLLGIAQIAANGYAAARRAEANGGELTPEDRDAMAARRASAEADMAAIGEELRGLRDDPSPAA